MASKKKETDVVETTNKKKDEKPQKKKASPLNFSSWGIAAIALLGMYLLTTVWPKPIGDLFPPSVDGDVRDGQSFDGMMSAPFVKDEPAQEAPTEQPQKEVVETPTKPVVSQDILNQLNQKISALTEITEAQQAELNALQHRVSETEVALIAAVNPEALIDTIQQEEALQDIDVSLLSPKISTNGAVARLFEAIYAGPLSREERTKAASGNLLEEADSSWKKTLSQWVSVKKQTVEDYAMAYDEQWKAHSDTLKTYLAKADYKGAIAWISESSLLSVDPRFVAEQKVLVSYMKQQETLKRVREFYAR